MRPHVVVFGGAGYVGHHVTQRLLADGFDVIVVGRDVTTARIVLGDLFPQITFHDYATPFEEHGAAEAVINLAQVKYSPFHRILVENEDLVRSVDRAARVLRCPRVVHASSLSVWGFPLRHPPRPVRVQMQRGDPYIECKIEAEHLFESLSGTAGYALALLRLGNVMGPASAAWTAGIAQRILEGAPVAFEGELGFSNSTYVANTADYIVRLVRTAPGQLRQFGAFHHVAEFAEHSWQPILDTLATAVAKRWHAVAPDTFQRADAPAGWLAFATRLQTGALGGYVRLALKRAGRWAWVDRYSRELGEAKRIRGLGLGAAFTAPATLGLLPETLSSRVCFRPHVIQGWQPPTSFEDALQAIHEWVIRSGYRYDWPSPGPAAS